MKQENREIAVYVAYKGVIELIKSKLIKPETLEETVREHFEILQRISQSEATESQINYLRELLETAVMDARWVRHIDYQLSKGITYEKYLDFKDKLLENQRENPNMNQGDIGNLVDIKVQQKHT